ncbi:tripartite tricarboxylate transporter substrate-binding protein [Salipaludibacillus neizhouensis]|nr:tripartite tricarboxylate transporter substrate-binding protein [Salipaludibacillus neizhouensis]
MKKKLMIMVLAILMMVVVAACNSNGDTETSQNNEGQETNNEQSNEANNSDSNAGAELEFPTQEIRVIVPYDPGGTSDSTARVVSDIIRKEELLPENVNVVNLPGANTRNGLEEVLNADPDGHTLLLHHSTLNAMNAVGQIDISYEDYELISQVSHTPSVLVGNADSEFQTFDEYLEEAESNPGSISVGITNIGSTTHLAYEAMMDAAGNPDAFKVVPFQSGADLVTAHLGGQVDLRMASTPDSIQYVESGDAVALVSSSYEKHFHPSLQDAVSFSELGVDTGVSVRFGFYAPPGTPEEVINYLDEVLAKVVENEEFQQFADDNGAEPEYLNSEEFIAENESVQNIFNTLAENIDIE